MAYKSTNPSLRRNKRRPRSVWFVRQVLLRANAGLGRDAPPLLDVATDAFDERLGWPGFRRHALRNQRLGPIAGFEDLIHLAIEPRDDPRRGVGRHNERNPQGGFVTGDAGF